MLKEKINKDFITAFKAKQMDVKNFLGLIKSTIENEEKRGNTELSDNDIIKILAKFEKNLEEVLAAVVKSGDNNTIQKTANEIGIVKSYMPEKLSELEIKNEIMKAITGGAVSMGEIMTIFKDKQADRKLVSQIAKELL